MIGRSWLTASLLGYGAIYALGATLIRRHEVVNLSEAAPPGSYTEIDGREVHFVEAGTGPPALLIHGFGASTFSFRETIPALSPRYAVAALDLPGFGYSDRSTQQCLSSTGQAEIVAKFMHRRGMEGSLVVAHSMGGAVALRVAHAHPHLVSRLVLVGTMHPNLSFMGHRRAILAQPLLPLVPFFSGLARLLRLHTMRRAVHDPAFLTPAILAGYDRPGRIRGSQAAAHRMLLDAAEDSAINLSQIQATTLLLWGESDRLLPLSIGRRLLEEIPDARLEVIEEAGHLLLEERPAAANAALLHWLEETEGAAPRTAHH